MDRHDQIHQAPCTDRSLRLLHLLGAHLLVRLLHRHQPLSVEVGALCPFRHRERLAVPGREEGGGDAERTGVEEVIVVNRSVTFETVDLFGMKKVYR